jgi:hypothetical protein
MSEAAFGVGNLVHVVQFRTVCKELEIIYITSKGSVEKISLTDRTKSGEVLHKIRDERSVLRTAKRRLT